MSIEDFPIILNCSFDAGLLIDEAGIILYANQQAVRLFGIDEHGGSVVECHIATVFLFGSTAIVINNREIHTWKDLMDQKANYLARGSSAGIEFSIVCKDKVSGEEFLGQVKFGFLSHQSVLVYIKKKERSDNIQIINDLIPPRPLERDDSFLNSGACISMHNYDVETMTGTLDSWQKECVLSSIMKISVDPLFQINSSGIIYLVNDAALQVFGFRRRDLIGKNISIIVGGGHASRHDKYIQNFIRSGVAKVMGKKRELLARRKDGTEFPIQLTVDEVETFSGDERLFCGFVHDLSEIKAKEREILHRQQLFSRIIECSLDSIFQINSNGIIEMVNQAAVDLFGYQEKSEMIGKNISMIVGAAHADKHDMYLRRYLETGDARVMGRRRELPARRKDGTEFTVELSIAEIKAEDGCGKRFVGFVYDLTAKKRFIAMEVEKTAAEALLMNVLPNKIARRLLDEQQQHIAESHENAAILFADIVGFTAMSQVMSPTEVVQMLNELFSTFDNLVERYALNKIKTIGDCVSTKLIDVGYDIDVTFDILVYQLILKSPFSTW
jgi:PAS domain S-box-containing protein